MFMRYRPIILNLELSYVIVEIDNAHLAFCCKTQKTVNSGNISGMLLYP